MSDHKIELRDFLEAANESSKRTRLVMIIIVVASVLAFVGFLNSYPWSWKLDRLRVADNVNSQYVKNKLQLEAAPTLEDERYRNFQQAVARDYVESSFTVRVPFFGFSFDINDLAFLGGITFIAVLLMFRFSIRNEIIGLRLAYNASLKVHSNQPEQLEAFYNLLAMRLVFTLPAVRGKDFDGKTNWVPQEHRFLSVVPKLICFLPSIVYFTIGVNDLVTKSVASEFNTNHVFVSLILTGLSFLIILILSVHNFQKLIKIDELWKKYRRFITEYEVADAPALGKTSDKAVDSLSTQPGLRHNEVMEASHSKEIQPTINGGA